MPFRSGALREFLERAVFPEIASLVRIVVAREHTFSEWWTRGHGCSMFTSGWLFSSSWSGILNDASNSSPSADSVQDAPDRRGFMAVSSTLAMGSGVAASYGTLAVMAGQYLYPHSEDLSWQFVCTIDKLKMGEAFDFVTTTGMKVVVTRQGEGDSIDNFVALSSICPHLGCQVHWESQNDRFFCPCHNGAFDKEGNPTAGPPLKENQQLLRFPLKVDGRMLFVQAPARGITGNNKLTAHLDRSCSLRRIDV